eukprot:4235012-Alexandrium_andersonii.AAC.1
MITAMIMKKTKNDKKKKKKTKKKPTSCFGGALHADEARERGENAEVSERSPERNKNAERKSRTQNMAPKPERSV